jgi:hypothetical protein
LQVPSWQHSIRAPSAPLLQPRRAAEEQPFEFMLIRVTYCSEKKEMAGEFFVLVFTPMSVFFNQSILVFTPSVFAAKEVAHDTKLALNRQSLCVFHMSLRSILCEMFSCCFTLTRFRFNVECAISHSKFVVEKVTSVVVRDTSSEQHQQQYLILYVI